MTARAANTTPDLSGNKHSLCVGLTNLVVARLGNFVNRHMKPNHEYSNLFFRLCHSCFPR
uniref:Uncharacterized protein n=1 Tax=Myoviridae sp. ctTK08 TaxID=2826656 RepID=A0A8S5QWV9_9CAUD|nr:MAG TPA: hypothetical protein [Myoviridae sp. ctTK08]